MKKHTRGTPLDPQFDFEPPVGYVPQKAHTMVRSTDPSTSKQSAKEFAGNVARIDAWAIECVTETPGKTQRELGEIHCPDDQRRVGRRMSYLAGLGLIRRGDARKCTISGRNSQTWWPI